MNKIQELETRIEKLESSFYGISNIDKISPIVRRTLESVSKATNVMIIDIVKKIRKREFVEARQMCFYILKTNTNMSLVSIGAIFGGKDHSSVIHGLQTHYNLIEVDKLYKKKFEQAINNYINYVEPIQVSEEEVIINAS